ncbi:hypothetical protein [Actinomadura chokoriensis]|uniref:hypothetical protein n=1 Tax=Actinomadura chokoriensis TaxID=454156 RepID=UPI0031F9A105
MFWALLFVQHEEGRPQKLARKWHGRYYVADDFDARAGECVRRASEAVAAVTEAEVGKAGLLDDVANAVALPQQEWEIARACAELTRIRQRLRQLASDDRRTRTLLQPEWHAVEMSDAAVRRRVAALERYADRARAADGAYREWQVVEAVQELRPELQELLARTVRDDLAVAEIDELSMRTPLAELRRCIEDARQAGLALALDGSEPA